MRRHKYHLTLRREISCLAAIDMSYASLTLTTRLLHKENIRFVMAKWKDILEKILLADGQISDEEITLLRKELYMDGKIDKSEMMFLIGLKNTAKKKSKEFVEFFYEAFKAYLLEDHVINAYKAELIRSVILADGKIDENGMRLLRDIQKEASRLDTLFLKLINEIEFFQISHNRYVI